jgi:hypothetical protein
VSVDSVVAVLPSRREADEAIRRLEAAGVPRATMSVMSPAPERDPAEEGENEGIGAVIGTVVGGAGGASLALGTVGLLVPGVGPVVAIGALASALVGAAGGAAVGHALDRTATDEGAPGGPVEASGLYRDALREGRALLVLPAAGEAERRAAILRDAGATRADVVPDDWWRELTARPDRPPSR